MIYVNKYNILFILEKQIQQDYVISPNRINWIVSEYNGYLWKQILRKKSLKTKCLCVIRYDCFTGVPVCQQNISLEKASVVFNMAALYSQIGTRANRQTQAGLEDAITAFQKSAGERCWHFI